MLLKSLTLKGFKSFADSTVLDMEPGVTVVVGPNGSGKSNVVDAIAWVLGAQAPTSVRSQKMDDVIFAGTSKRPALGRAEVSLTIDNSSKLLPIDFEEVTITRTLFREGESEYSLNGVPCRLLDIQDLLSDSGVGRQQHVIVSQGQIDGVLSARAEDRRAIIEEAAGILKYRRRREKAQRRLLATEENLTRVQDLLREVRRQLRPLERQADAARRHGGLVDELTTLQIHLGGRNVDSLRGRLQVVRTERTDLDERDTALKATLKAGDEEVSIAEARLSATGADDIGDDLARVEALRERAKGLSALLGERLAGLGRELDSTVDQGLVESLEAEAASLRTEITDVAESISRLEPDTLRVSAAETQVSEQRQLFDNEHDVPTAKPVGEAAELRGQLSAIESSIALLERDQERLSQRLPELLASVSLLGQSSNTLAGDLERLSDQAEALATGLAEAGSRLEESQDACSRADQRVHEAESERRAWTARADALSLALEQARSDSGAERLAEVEGVLGTVLELIDIDDGWESAFEAAAGPALAAVVVRDVGAAKRALQTLRGHGVSGGILALDVAPTAAGDGELRAHIRSDDARVSGLLDRLVGAVGVVEDWAAGVDAALDRPDRVFVSLDGDRFAPDGWRVGMTGSGATGHALEEALQRAEHAISALDECRRQQEVAHAQRATHVEEHDRLASELRDATVARDRTRERLGQVDSDLRANRVEADGLGGQLDAMKIQLIADRERQAALSSALPELEEGEQAALALSEARNHARDALERKSAEVAALRADLEIRAAGLEERKTVLEARLDEIDGRLARYAARRAQAAERREYLEKRLALAQFLRSTVEARGQQIELELAGLRDERRAQSDAAKAASLRLDELRRSRSEAERQLGELRELSTRNELQEGEIGLKLEAAIEALRRDHGCEPGRAIDTECPPLDGVTPATRVRELERELRIMGPINPLALEEYEALNERQEFLQGQLDDVRSSRRELNKVIRAVDAEIVQIFSAAFSDVSENFEQLFGALFPGGVGKLKLTAPDDLLNTGIDLEAKPSGKNVKKLSLLSGGERSLTALAFLFAVFRSRPSPFYVMDEVEAALDDVNLHRFLQLVAEFRDEAQLIIVSHQKRTMEAADCLYGVTMQPGGSSKVLSEKPGADIDLTAMEHRSESQTEPV